MIDRFLKFISRKPKEAKVTNRPPDLGEAKNIVKEFIDDRKDSERDFRPEYYQFVEIDGNFLVYIRRENRNASVIVSDEEVDSLVYRLESDFGPVVVYGNSRVTPYRQEHDVYIFDSRFIDKMINKYFSGIKSEIIDDAHHRARSNGWSRGFKGLTVYMMDGEAVMLYDRNYSFKGDKYPLGAVTISYNLWHVIRDWFEKLNFGIDSWVTFALLACMFKSKFGISTYPVAGGGNVYDSYSG